MKSEVILLEAFRTTHVAKVVKKRAANLKTINDKKIEIILLKFKELNTKKDINHG